MKHSIKNAISCYGYKENGWKYHIMLRILWIEIDLRYDVSIVIVKQSESRLLWKQLFFYQNFLLLLRGLSPTLIMALTLNYKQIWLFD